MNSQNIIVLDLETQKSFKEVNASSNRRLERLRVSVVGIYDYIDDQYRIYEEKEIMTLENRLKNVELVVGFNIRRFDLPVLSSYLFMPVDQIRLLDLLEDVEKARGHRASLESLVRPTLNQQKSGSGLEALELFKEKRMEELKQYCLDDVRLTKDLYEYGVKKGRVLFTSSWDYKTYEIPVRWKEDTESVLNKASSEDPNPFPSSLF